MKTTKHRLFFVWQYEDEEKWLNQMSEAGQQLCDVGFCTYTFEEGEPSRYQYRLQFLDDLPTNYKSREYIAFLEDLGIKYIGNYGRWVYLRKENDGNDFNLFSDMKSIIKHLNKIILFCSLIVLFLTISTINMAVNFTFSFNSAVFWIGVVSVGFMIFCLAGIIRLQKKKRQLVKAAEIHE